MPEENDTQNHLNGAGSPVSFCWAMTMTMQKVDMDTRKIETFQALGSRFCNSEDEAVGWFVRESMRKNPGFLPGPVMTLKINWPND